MTLPGTLMNHTNTIHSVSELLNFSRSLHNPHSLPFILGETNSLFRQGRPGLSNTFGAALWGVDSISGALRTTSLVCTCTKERTIGTRAGSRSTRTEAPRGQKRRIMETLPSLR